jgi:hypothetical protein
VSAKLDSDYVAFLASKAVRALLLRTAELVESDSVGGYHIGAYSAFYAAARESFRIVLGREPEAVGEAWSALWRAWGELGGGHRDTKPEIVARACRVAAGEEAA